METDTSQMITLNGPNYQSWKIRMEDHLRDNGLHQPIICPGKPNDKTNEEWNMLHRQVCAYIRQWVDESVLSYVSEDINARILWNKLEQKYAPKTCVSKMVLIKKLMSLRYCDGAAMSDYLNTFQGIINQLSELGVEINDEFQGLWLLGTLPDSWNVFISSVLNATQDGVISVDSAKQSVLNEEMRRRAHTLCPFMLPGAAPSDLYTTIKVARDEDLRQQIGDEVYFDLVNHEKVFTLCVLKQVPFSYFKEEVARKFGITAPYQRYWLWALRENKTYRPLRRLTTLEEAQPVGTLLEESNKTNNANHVDLKLFLEVEIGKDSWPVLPPKIIKDKIMLFFKVYDPSKEELWYAGRLWVKLTSKPKEILKNLNELAGFAPDQEIELYEENKLQGKYRYPPVSKEHSFRANKMKDGDIICFQKALQAGTTVTYRYPDLPLFLERIHFVQVVGFRPLTKHSTQRYMCLNI